MLFDIVPLNFRKVFRNAFLSAKEKHDRDAAEGKTKMNKNERSLQQNDCVRHPNLVLKSLYLPANSRQENAVAVGRQAINSKPTKASDRTVPPSGCLLISITES